MARALRLAFALLSALCVWLWGGVAAAYSTEAPQCDVRAATSFGAPPVLQPLLATMEPVRSTAHAASASCAEAELDDGASWQQGQPQPSAQPRTAPEPLALPGLSAAHLVLRERGTAKPRAALSLRAASAHLRALERPPR